MNRDDPTSNPDLRWTAVCALSDILPDTGVCALVAGRPVAVFHVPGLDGPQVLAIDNHDPHSGAGVLSRGLVGSLGNRVVVASPLYKQHFCLQTGQCIEAPEISVGAYPARVENGQVLVAG